MCRYIEGLLHKMKDERRYRCGWYSIDGKNEVV